MNKVAVLNNIKKDYFSRQDLLSSALDLYGDYTNTQLRYLVSKYIEHGEIIRVGHNCYAKAKVIKGKKTYLKQLSEEAAEVISQVEKAYPFINFQVWELRWLNDFVNHLLARNIIFLDVENDGCEFVYSSLSEKFLGKILLRPTTKEMTYYSTDNAVLIERLVSESPANSENIHIASIEKIIVDLFANKTLMTLVSKGDYADILENIFSKYQVDEKKMFRYARRRNKEAEIREYINNNTDIKLINEERM